MITEVKPRRRTPRAVRRFRVDYGCFAPTWLCTRFSVLL